MNNTSKIRNFAIIAHVDHGKSTLADRLLEATGTIPKSKMHEQFLDQNAIGREHGITIKLAPVRMFYNGYILNLIDTPGHADFSYEVSRTLAACEGAILLVDATQGIQAQTVAHYITAEKEGLKIIPVINKIDLEAARVNETKNQLFEVFGFKKEEILEISAKTGKNVSNLLNEIIEKIPSPQGSEENSFRALIFDAVFDEHRGVILYIKVFDGLLDKHQKIKLYQNEAESIVNDLGYFSPSLVSQKSLGLGEIGYIVTGIKDIRQARVGDTVFIKDKEITSLPGYLSPKPMIFFGIYPKNSADLIKLRQSLSKISLNDSSITISDESSAFLGNGFRVGFLGLLHAEITKERIEKENNLPIILTMPQILYKKEDSGMFYEPYVRLLIYSPQKYLGSIMNLCQKRKGKLIDVKYLEDNMIAKYEVPYSVLIKGLSAELKSISSGFASLDYELIDYRIADVVDINILINGVLIDVLSEKVYKDEAVSIARKKITKLKETLPRQQFRQIVQGEVSGVIVAREEIPPFRKDVLAKMSGGDRTRKDKLLEKQKKGKSKLLQTSKIEIPQNALYSLLGEN